MYKVPIGFRVDGNIGTVETRYTITAHIVYADVREVNLQNLKNILHQIEILKPLCPSRQLIETVWTENNSYNKLTDIPFHYNRITCELTEQND